MAKSPLRYLVRSYKKTFIAWGIPKRTAKQMARENALVTWFEQGQLVRQEVTDQHTADDYVSDDLSYWGD